MHSKMHQEITTCIFCNQKDTKKEIASRLDSSLHLVVLQKCRSFQCNLLEQLFNLLISRHYLFDLNSLLNHFNLKTR